VIDFCKNFVFEGGESMKKQINFLLILFNLSLTTNINSNNNLNVSTTNTPISPMTIDELNILNFSVDAILTNPNAYEQKEVTIVIDTINHLEQKVKQSNLYINISQIYKNLFEYFSQQLSLANTQTDSILDEIIARHNLLPTDDIRSKFVMIIKAHILSSLHENQPFTTDTYEKLFKKIFESFSSISDSITNKVGVKENNPPKHKKKRWFKKRYLALLLLLLSVGIIIGVGRKIYSKIKENERCKEAAKEHVRCMEKSLQQQEALLQQLVQNRHEDHATINELTTLTNDLSKDNTRNIGYIEKNHIFVKELIQSCNKNSKAVGHYVKQTEDYRAAHLENLENYRTNMFGYLNELKEYARHIEDLKWRAEETRPWYDKVIPDFTISNASKIISAAGKVFSTLNLLSCTVKGAQAFFNGEQPTQVFQEGASNGINARMYMTTRL
jgi:hypothetical protein